MESVVEDIPMFKDQEKTLQSKNILWHEDKILRSGKVIKQYLVKSRIYPFEDASWMQDIYLKDNLLLVNDYSRACQE